MSTLCQMLYLKFHRCGHPIKGMDRMVDSHWEGTLSKTMKTKHTDFDMLQTSALLVHQGDTLLKHITSVSVLTKSLLCLFEHGTFIEKMSALIEQVKSNASQYSAIYRLFLQPVIYTVPKCYLPITFIVDFKSFECKIFFYT